MIRILKRLQLFSKFNQLIVVNRFSRKGARDIYISLLLFTFKRNASKQKRKSNKSRYFQQKNSIHLRNCPSNELVNPLRGRQSGDDTTRKALADYNPESWMDQQNLIPCDKGPSTTNGDRRRRNGENDGNEIDEEGRALCTNLN